MATRRMFSKDITDSDAFNDMPLSTQALYFHLGMNADDDGFVNNPKRIKRVIGASDDDLSLLVVKGFVIPFESGVVVIKHWKTNNLIRNDRYKATRYQEELSLLDVKNGAYTLKSGMPELLVSQMETDGKPNDNQWEPQVRLGKDRLGKDSKNHIEPSRAKKEPKHRHGEHGNVLLTDSELSQLQAKFPNDWQKRIDDLSYYIGSKGDKYKSHYLTILSWDRKNAPKGVKQDATLDRYID